MRFIEKIKIGADGEPLPLESQDHVAVKLPALGLIYTRRPINERAKTQEVLEAECASFECAGLTGWQMIDPDELQLIIDRSRHSPALDPAFFDVPADAWLITRGDCAWQKKNAAGRSPSVWGVDAGYGGVGYGHRGYDGFALAVRRVGQ